VALGELREVLGRLGAGWTERARASQIHLILGWLSGPVAGQDPGDGGAVLQKLDELAAPLMEQLRELVEATRQQTRSLEWNTQAVLESAAAFREGRWSRAGAVVERILSGLGGGLGLLGFLGSLFAGRGNKEPTEPVVYVRPGRITQESLVSALSPSIVSPYEIAPSGTVPRRDTAPFAPTVTVQVQAMDARSFLDRSEEIAQAVERALLNSHRLRDVISEL